MIRNFASWFFMIKVMGFEDYLKLTSVLFYVFFLISFIDIRLSALKLCNFFCGIILISYLESRVSQVNLGWLEFFSMCFFNWLFFLCLLFHHLVFLRVDLHCIIQFFICEFILISRISCEFSMLAWVKFYFLKIEFFSIHILMFALLIIELHIYFIF
jgi:hypothetical protein